MFVCEFRFYVFILNGGKTDNLITEGIVYKN